MCAPDLKETYMVIGDCVQLVFVITITCVLLRPLYRFEETLSLAFLQEELATTLNNISLVGYSRIQFPLLSSSHWSLLHIILTVKKQAFGLYCLLFLLSCVLLQNNLRG